MDWNIIFVTMMTGCKNMAATLVTERGQGHGQHLRVIAEEVDQGLAVNQQTTLSTQTKTERRKDCENSGLPYPAVLFGTIVERGHGLQALAHADGDGQDEHKDAGDDAHARHGGVAVLAGGNVQQHTANAVQALTAEAGGTVGKDEQVVARRAGDLGDAESG